ncbi:helix-turn-helix domain-containing protein [Aquabacter sp. CN5-332]|uniref:winged helix-turn-helix transcriptional regulator n=1 Tax=Aquabacter sp. CN5-332 TaxID=3156608 RepID=UPI0032B4B889
MDNRVLSQKTCPVARGLACVGDAWSMLILRDAGRGLTRFDQFRRNLGIAPNILARRLAALTEVGLLETRRYSDHPPRADYVLTEAGRDFLPVLALIGAWGRKHNGRGHVNRLIDAETGAEVRPIAIDAATGIPIGTRPLRMAAAEAPNS